MKCPKRHEETLSPVKYHRAPTLPLDLQVPATFYVVRRILHLFFSHSTPGTCFLDALRHQRDEESRWDCASLLEEKRDDRENRVKDERSDREGTIGRGRAAHEGVACLNQDQHGNESDDAHLPRDRAVAFQIEHRAEKKNSDLQDEFDGSVIPKTEADFQRVVID